MAVIEMNPLEAFSMEPLPSGDSCVLVIFGASGDLTRRKLIPGLYNLACVGCMNPEFDVLGIGRTSMTSEAFRAKMKEAVAGSGDARNFNEAQWAQFEKRLNYFVGDINDKEFYPRLRDRLEEMEKAGSSHNRLFYVSTPASVARPIIEGLAHAELNHHGDAWTHGWLQAEIERRATTPASRILALFDVYNEWFHSDDYRGCLLLNSLQETRDPGSPVRAASQAALDDIRALIRDLGQAAGAHDPERLAFEIHTLLMGSVVAAVNGNTDAAARMRPIARLLLEHENIAA